MILTEACQLADCLKNYFDSLDQWQGERSAGCNDERGRGGRGGEGGHQGKGWGDTICSIPQNWNDLTCGCSRLFPILRRPWKKNSNWRYVPNKDYLDCQTYPETLFRRGWGSLLTTTRRSLSGWCRRPRTPSRRPTGRVVMAVWILLNKVLFGCKEIFLGFSKSCLVAVNLFPRWTDNIFSIQEWVKKKFPSIDQASNSATSNKW